MSPLDQPADESLECRETKIARDLGPGPEGVENKMGNNVAAPAPRAEDELPPLWRLPSGKPDPTVYIYGPKAACFEEAPPPTDEPPEPQEAIGEALTARQLAFCERYVERPVAVRAAREAGYAENTAAHQASRLLKHPLVMRRILELRRKRGLEAGYRRETLLDKFEIVFGEAIERREFYAAIQALTMQARLARIDEASPGFRHFRRFEDGREQVLWDVLTRLEQKLTEITVGDFPGAASAIPAKPFAEGAAEEERKRQGYGSAEQRASDAVRTVRPPRRRGGK
jgi:hypothetical protein